MKNAILISILVITASGGRPIGCSCSAAETSNASLADREATFAFARKPRVDRDGDQSTIRFASGGYCDVTVAIENGEGRTLRYLASGVLGKNAPPPLQRNSLQQTIVWDGKDEMGRYVEKMEDVRVRVSLGLKAQFERTLYWSPKRRLSGPVLLATAPEGLYVFDGAGVDHLRLFDRRGRYLRTVYPFPRCKLPDVEGLQRHDYPEDDKCLPIKTSFYQHTMLTSGVNGYATYRDGRYNSACGKRVYRGALNGAAATAMAVRGKRVCLAGIRVNHLATDGSTGGVPLHTSSAQLGFSRKMFRGEEIEVTPRCAALSPDGEWLYLSGFYWNSYTSIRFRWHLADRVHRVRVGGKGKPQVFPGKQTNLFKGAMGVACDAKGRVYVANHGRDEVLVFNHAGNLLRRFAVPRPVWVAIHHETQEIIVLSWYLEGFPSQRAYPPRLFRMGTFDAPRRLAGEALPLDLASRSRGAYNANGGYCNSVALDTWSKELAIWVDTGSGIRRLVRNDDKWAFDDIHFQRDVERNGVRTKPPCYSRQRLYANPKNGKCYLAEIPGYLGKPINELVELDPDTGKTRFMRLPMTAEDVCFDQAGRIYLRSVNHVVRLDPADWREIPWDYGEEGLRVRYASGRDGSSRRIISGLRSVGINTHHMGGMGVSPQGRIAVSCYPEGDVGERGNNRTLPAASSFQPKVYPGRLKGLHGPIVRIADAHGQFLHQDAVPGLPETYGVQIDRAGNVYVMASAARATGGRRHFNDLSCTLMKFKPGRGKLISDRHTPVPLTDSTRPKRAPDLFGHMGAVWVQGAEWLYGGVGISAGNRGACACWNARFALDYFGRSFAPEIHRYGVAVLDAEGNRILRIGRYGNVDDGSPLIARGGPPTTRSIGGDEVGLFHGAYVATATDRRLFIADPGNARVVSVRLGYHAESILPLKGASDELAVRE